MVRSAGAATPAAVLVDVKRSSPIEKGKGKEKAYPPWMTGGIDPDRVHPDIVCVRDERASVQGANLINHQGIFCKVVKSNGKLSNSIYEGFFTILDEKTLTWSTVSGVELPSEMTWAAMIKYTNLKKYLDNKQPHPPVWWTRNHYPTMKRGGLATRQPWRLRESEAAA